MSQETVFELIVDRVVLSITRESVAVFDESISRNPSFEESLGVCVSFVYEKNVDR